MQIISKFAFFYNIDYYLYVMNKNNKKQSENTSSYCTKCFGSLGVASRMKIYLFIKKSGKSDVNRIVKHINLRQPTVSYHLKDMKILGLLDSVRKGKKIYYSINKNCPINHSHCVLGDLNI